VCRFGYLAVPLINTTLPRESTLQRVGFATLSEPSAEEKQQEQKKQQQEEELADEDPAG
jgi:hypothetical protein